MCKFTHTSHWIGLRFYWTPTSYGRSPKYLKTNRLTDRLKDKGDYYGPHRVNPGSQITMKSWKQLLKKPCFQFVKKICSNIGDRLSVLKSLALRDKVGSATPCFGHANCKCCGLIKEPTNEINGILVSLVPGNCKSKMIVYLVYCRLCLCLFSLYYLVQKQ